MSVQIVKDTWQDVGVMVGLAPGEIRGAGHTSHQMLSAPKGAVFIWCLGDITYPKKLARELGREDLEIWPSSKWTLYQWDAHRRPIVVDHAYLEHNRTSDLMARAI